MKKYSGNLSTLLVLLVGIVILSNILVVTHQNEYKLIRQFGKVQKVVSQPGLTVKIPLIQTIDTITQQQIVDLATMFGIEMVDIQ